LSRSQSNLHRHCQARASSPREGLASCRPAWHPRRPRQRHCGTGVWPGRDIVAGWREMESSARLCRPDRQAVRAHPRGKPGFSTFESGCGRETDSPLEGAGFEPSVPLLVLTVSESPLVVSVTLSLFPLCQNGVTPSRPGDRGFESGFLQQRVSDEPSPRKSFISGRSGEHLPTTTPSSILQSETPAVSGVDIVLEEPSAPDGR
jgi:hypothetical protein